MRVTSELFVAALIRRAFSEGAMAVVMRRGAAEAGAVFVVVDRLDRTEDFYAPAPQTAFGADAVEGRLFVRVALPAEPGAVARRLEREARFDPDLWAVGIEDRAGRAFLDLAPDTA